MFRTTRSAARTSRPRARLSLRDRIPFFLPLLMVLCLAGMDLAPRPAAAQDPTRPPLRVQVQSDRAAYRPGEPIQLKVLGTNPTDQPLTLGFTSGCLADYGFDGPAFAWLRNRPCTMNAPTVVVAPGATYNFGTFSHTPDLFPLGPGRHELWGEEIGRAHV